MTFHEVYLDREAWSRTFVKSCLLLNVYLEVVRESHRHTAQTLKQLQGPETSAVFKALRDKSRRPHEIHSTVSVNSAQMAGTSGRDQDQGKTVSRNAKGYTDRLDYDGHRPTTQESTLEKALQITCLFLQTLFSFCVCCILCAIVNLIRSFYV